MQVMQFSITVEHVQGNSCTLLMHSLEALANLRKKVTWKVIQISFN